MSDQKNLNTRAGSRLLSPEYGRLVFMMVAMLLFFIHSIIAYKNAPYEEHRLQEYLTPLPIFACAAFSLLVRDDSVTMQKVLDRNTKRIWPDLARVALVSQYLACILFAFSSGNYAEPIANVSFALSALGSAISLLALSRNTAQRQPNTEEPTINAERTSPERRTLEIERLARGTEESSLTACIWIFILIFLVVIGGGALIVKTPEFTSPAIELRKEFPALDELENALHEEYAPIFSTPCVASLTGEIGGETVAKALHSGSVSEIDISTLSPTSLSCLESVFKSQSDLQLLNAIEKMPTHIEVQNPALAWIPLATRITIGALIMYIVQILWSAYRHSMQVARFYRRIADTALLLETPTGTISPKEYLEIMKPDMGFGAPPQLPFNSISELVDLAKRSTGKPEDGKK